MSLKRFYLGKKFYSDSPHTSGNPNSNFKKELYSSLGEGTPSLLYLKT
jgi:hypothetical protein